MYSRIFRVKFSDCVGSMNVITKVALSGISVRNVILLPVQVDD